MPLTNISSSLVVPFGCTTKAKRYHSPAANFVATSAPELVLSRASPGVMTMPTPRLSTQLKTALDRSRGLEVLSSSSMLAPAVMGSWEKKAVGMVSSLRPVRCSAPSIQPPAAQSKLRKRASTSPLCHRAGFSSVLDLPSAERARLRLSLTSLTDTLPGLTRSASS